MLSAKSTISQELKKTRKLKKYVSEYYACFGMMFFFQKILRILNDCVLKTKNHKIDFSFVSEHCATFWTIRMALFDEGGGFDMSLTRKDPTL